MPPRSFFFFVVFKERKRIRNKTHAWVSVETRKKHLQEEQHRIARVYSFKTTARQDGGVWSSFFFSVDTDLIIRLAAEGCGKIVADGGGTVFDPVHCLLEPSARPNSPRRVESSVRTGGRSRICGLASTFFSRCHKQKIGPKKFASTPCTSSFRTEEEEEAKETEEETEGDEER